MVRNGKNAKGASTVETRRVPGFHLRCNDILDCPATTTDAPTLCIFFPGDLQTVRAEMAPEWARYCLEDVTQAMASATAGRCLCVRAARMSPDGQAYYDHLTCPGSSLRHLKALLQGLDVQNKRLVLVGFSKGCVVLNALLSEIATLDTGASTVIEWESSIQVPKYLGAPLQITRANAALVDDEAQSLRAFAHCIDAIHYLDSHRFITNPAMLDVLAQTGWADRIVLHSTPRQLADVRRPWIKQEYEAMAAGLSSHLRTKPYFMDHVPSLKMHFELLYTWDASNK